MKKHLRVYGQNLLYGHTHAIGIETMPSTFRKIPLVAYNIGCVTNVNPEWQRSKSNQWQLGFGYGWFDKKTGDFDVVVKRIIHDQFHAEGKVYSGKEQ